MRPVAENEGLAKRCEREACVPRQELNWASYSYFKLGLLEDDVTVRLVEKHTGDSSMKHLRCMILSRHTDATRNGLKGSSQLGLLAATLQPNE
jgi:hypothetical protein